MICRESLSHHHSKKPRFNHYQNQQQQEFEDLSAHLDIAANADDEIKSLISDFQFEPDPFEDSRLHAAAQEVIHGNMEMHGPPSNENSREIFLHQAQHPTTTTATPSATGPPGSANVYYSGGRNHRAYGSGGTDPIKATYDHS